MSNEMYPLTEASAPPQCSHALVEIAAADGELLLACWTCFKFWRTGLKDADSEHLISHRRLVSAAQKRYVRAA